MSSRADTSTRWKESHDDDSIPARAHPSTSSSLSRPPPLSSWLSFFSALSAVLQPRASADGIPLRSLPPLRTSTIDGTVSAVTGTVLDVIGGQFRIDVANATITRGDGPLAGPLPATGIPVGARVVAQVVVPDAVAAVFPLPPFQATTVVVFLPRDGQLASTIQGVDVAGGTFTMFFRSISTNAATKWSGYGPNGPVKGIGDLTAGMFATVSVVNEAASFSRRASRPAGAITPPAPHRVPRSRQIDRGRRRGRSTTTSFR